MKKHLLNLMLIAVAMICGASSAWADNKTIGLVPGPWAADGATFAAYVWDGTGNAWVPFVEKDGVYATQIADTYTGLTVVRLKPATDASFSMDNYGLNWDNKWNQTADIDLTTVANQSTITITGWNEGDFTITAPVTLDDVKAQLQEAIAKATALNEYANDADLAAAIAAATEALNAEDATVQTLAAAGTALQEKATTAAKNTLQTAVTMAKSLGMEADEITAAEALLTNEEATAEQFAAALQALYEKAIPTATTALGEAKKFFETFDGDAATKLAPYFAAVETALAGKNINEMVQTMAVLIAQAKRASQKAMDKLIEYFNYLDDEALKADVAALQAAFASEEANSFLTMINIAKKGVEDFKAAIPTYLAKVQAMNTEGKEKADELNAAITALQTALANEKETIPNIALAVRNLVLAVKAFVEANTVYTIAGNATFLGEWNTTVNVMTKNSEGIYEITFENVELEQDYIVKYKVVKTDGNGNTEWIPDGDDLTYKVWQGTDKYNVTFTYNPETKEAACAMVPVGMANLIADAEALVAEGGVAVGKLEDAIEKAKVGDVDQAGLQAAIDQYNEDNKDQEKDETAKVATDGWKKYDGSNAGICATQFAPAIDTYDGRKNVQLAEVYETTVETTGTIIYQDITGLQNGKYKVGFYGNAFYTSGRGFESPMEDGASDVAYVFANDEKEFITARIATSTTENNFRQFDVEVTDGTIKLGMGKEKAGTNWHTMQIYQLTWFTTAKEVYAADQAELKVLLREAKALLADENKTVNKDAFELVIAAAEQSVDSKMLNIAEIENVISNLKDAIADFKKANWYIDFAAGEYYIIDAESGLMMAAGNAYGTHGIVNEMGLDLTLTPYAESRTVTIDSRVSNGGDNHFLGSNMYMDSSSWGFALEYQGFGFYILEPDGGKYINIDKDNNLVLSDTPREFIIVTKEGVVAERMDELAAATKDSPVDATFLLQNPNFNRNDQRVKAWTWNPMGDSESNPDFWNNHNFNGGNGVNNCAESYHAAFTVMQTVEGAPKGMYSLTAQGFYRQDTYDGEEAPATPVFFANNINGNVPALAEGGPNGMSTASEAFSNGDYTIEPIYFDVTGEGDDAGKIYVGVTTGVANQWVIWDNFRLTYYGTDTTTGISEVSTANQQRGAEGIFNLQGQKVKKAQKGLYIVDGKKVVLK